VNAGLKTCATAIALTVAACAPRSPAGGPPSLDAAAESYVRLVLALGERDPDAVDNYRGPAEWQADARRRHATLGEIARDATSLVNQLETDTRPSADDGERARRRAFLARQLRAVAARARIVGGERPRFEDEARALFGLETPPPFVDGSRALEELDRLLPGRGDLASRYAAFDRQFLIAPDRLNSVLTRAIDACRAITAAHITLPPGERVQLELVPTLSWSAFTRYRGRYDSLVQVNSSLPLTIDRALDLACHEGYPGHHTIESLVEQRLGSTRVELLVQPLFSPQSLLHEAASSVAPQLAFSGSDRLRFERDTLFPLAGLDPRDAERYVRVEGLVDYLHPATADIAREYLDGELDFPRAAARLEHDALMPFPDTTLKFLNQFRTYAATYTTGRDRLLVAIDRLAHSRGSSRWDAYVRIVTDPAQTFPLEPRR
jgi:hypothetical protein